MLELEKLIAIQTALNDYTLKECNVHIVEGNQAVLGSMSLAQREGTFLRHSSALVHLVDMYQWAGNREYRELLEVLGTDFSIWGTDDKEKARFEIVDILHFDLSLLALTKTVPTDIPSTVGLGTLAALAKARALFDNLQLTKWWTKKTITVAEIRDHAVTEFVSLITFATESELFEGQAEIVETYLQKVDINYKRIQNNYDHIKDKDKSF
jgi:dimeric dUTPase (all-alpha-NTP-PPase superfamily)